MIKADSRHPEGLNDNYLHELFLDRENALWIGTYFGGVNYVSSVQDNFRHYHKDNSQLDARIISVFAHADKGNLWIGTDDAGFFYWDRQSRHFRGIALKKESQDLPIITYMPCYKMETNCLWVCLWVVWISWICGQASLKIIRQILLRVHCILLKSMHFIKIPDRKYGLVLLPD